ncbi:hypothetical protein PVL29_008458 [Vitis rotundifolia]|uniref:Uncharacterized protein n=1 Tax=Vitis rotundifolia TaxID=103349 RepID=A0AA39DTB5_VITRO|nr:hypothetical protein PVL29_008458 [Vitis rotundifolia]
MPMALLARPSRRKVGAQEKRNFDTETTSSASSPPVAVRVTVLSGKTPHVLLLHPGRGAEKQSPQPLALANEHWADRHRAGRYEEDT